jgi:hypothetical protein
MTEDQLKPDLSRPVGGVEEQESLPAELTEATSCAVAGTDTAPRSEAAQAALDYAWRGVDACGGTYTPEEEASGYADAHRGALDAALAAVEALGAKPS